MVPANLLCLYLFFASYKPDFARGLEPQCGDVTDYAEAEETRKVCVCMRDLYVTMLPFSSAWTGSHSIHKLLSVDTLGYRLCLHVMPIMPK